MVRIVWDRPFERTVELGVEKGVLYIQGEAVPWNGLVSISENPVQGEIEPRYQDGVKTHNDAPILEFESEITALTYPEEFEKCLGYDSPAEGFLLGQQPRVPFNVSYQTGVSGGLMGAQRGMKIHLIYNAIATPNQTQRTTDTSESVPVEFSWLIQTAPVEVSGYRPASHFTIDPSKIGPRMYDHIYDRLYGSELLNPRLLYPNDIFKIVGDWEILYPSTTTYPSLETLPGGP